MRAFRDHGGREWVVRIDPSQGKLVRARTGVDLFALTNNNLGPLGDLLADPIRFVDVLWVLCEAEARARSVSEEAFGAGLFGDPLGAAVDAFVEELVDFFPDASRRERMRRLMATGRAISEEIAAEQDRELASLDPKAVVRKLTSGSSSTSLPASPDSTPPT